jgi:hypothetical protein
MRAFIKGISLMCAMGALAAGCATSESEPMQKPTTQAEVRNFQTRTFEAGDHALVMKAMINVLQDLNFIIKTADSQLGVLTAEKWSNIEHTKKELKKAKKAEIALPQSAVIECTANVSVAGAQTRVRAIFQQRVMGPGGTVMEVTRVDDPAFYQEFFSKVDKGIYLQREGI